MNVPVKIEISGPVPVQIHGHTSGHFVIAEVIVLWGEGPVFEAQGRISLLFLTVMLTRPIVSAPLLGEGCKAG